MFKNIYFVCDVTSSPLPIAPRGGGGNDPRGRVKDRARARYRYFRCHDVTSGREKRRKPTRIYDYDVTSGL